MKSRQINFFVMPDEWEPLENYLKENNLLLIEKEMDSKNIVPSPLNNGKNRKYIYSPEFKSDIDFYSIEETKKYYIRSINSAVIEFGKPYFDKEKNVLRSSRLYYTTGFWNKNDEWQEKPEEFKRMADKLFKWFKKTYKNVKLENWEVFTVTKNVKEKVENEGLLLTQV